MISSLCVDWAAIGRQIKDFFVKDVVNFFVNLPDNKLWFSLFIAGCAVLFIGLISLIIGVSLSKKAKKAKKAKEREKTKKAADKKVEKQAVSNSAPQPAVRKNPAPQPINDFVVPEPIQEFIAPQPVEEKFYDENIDDDIAEPVYNEPVYDEPVYNEPVYDEPVYNEPASEEDDISFAMPYGEAAPTYEKPQEEPVEKENIDSGNDEDFSLDDGGWKSAKIVTKKQKEDERPKIIKEKAQAVRHAPEKEEETVEETQKEVAKPAPKKTAPKKPTAKKPATKKATTKKEVVEATVPVTEKPVEETAASVVEEDKPKVVGKYTIEAIGEEFQFRLYANNGQLLYESREYASINSCKSGINTFKKNIAICDYRVDEDKNGGFKFIFKKGNSIYIGETYSTYKAAENSAESVKRFANVSELVD